MTRQPVRTQLRVCHSATILAAVFAMAMLAPHAALASNDVRTGLGGNEPTTDVGKSGLFIGA